jgi:hypothetical protein
MRWMLLAGIVLSVTACGRWKGSGADEVLPDVVGIASKGKVPKSFGVPSQMAPGEHADQNIAENRQAAEPEERSTAAGGHESARHGVKTTSEHKAD